MRADDQWLAWIQELQALSQSALAYCKDPFDIERFQRIREIAAQMLAQAIDAPIGTVRAVFTNESGYQTPKIDTRAAVVREGKLLLVQENDGRWTLPGGWCDANCSIAENTRKEVYEEAGMQVRTQRLIALLDRNRHLNPPHIHEITTVVVLCEYISGAYQPNIETRDSRFFATEEFCSLPLHTGKCNMEILNLCMRAAADNDWQPILD